MEKFVFDFKDPWLNAGSALRCTLNVVIGTEGFSLLAREKDGQIRALQTQHFSQVGRDFRDVETQIRTVFGFTTLLSHSFSELRCAFFNHNATLVPRRLFDPENLPRYFKILLRPAEYEFRFDELPEFDCFLVYAIEPMLTRTCGQYFPQAKLTHLATPLLKNWQRSAPPSDYTVCVNVRNHAAQVAVFDRKNLLLYNAFQFQKPNDLLYFVLLAYDQFRLNASEIPLMVSGHLFEDSDHFRLLHRYIREVRFAVLPETTILPEEADSLPAHYWYDLLSFSQSSRPNGSAGRAISNF
jgi:hypothetical protein